MEWIEVDENHFLCVFYSGKVLLRRNIQPGSKLANSLISRSAVKICVYISESMQFSPMLWLVSYPNGMEIIPNHGLGGKYWLKFLLFASFWALGIVLGHLSLAGFQYTLTVGFSDQNSQSFDFSCFNSSQILKSLDVTQVYLLMR